MADGLPLCSSPVLAVRAPREMAPNTVMDTGHMAQWLGGNDTSQVMIQPELWQMFVHLVSVLLLLLLLLLIGFYVA